MAEKLVPPIEKRQGNASKKIIVGVCAMARKANSKPMRAIIGKITEFYKDWLEFVIFPEEVILNDPVEDWPLCDCLISFHATGFPLHKAIEYERLRRPYVINDLHRQYDLLDRRKVFRSLARAGIDHPRHCVLIRNEEGKVVGGDLKEYNDSIEVNGMVFNKPFVEKPISAEDHNIYIYFPSSVGSGCQQIFRKVDNRSSRYSTVSTVRREGSYIYEEFIPADGTDVKVYAVGPYYAHAEARKAPGLDGKVERDADGKEIRYPVILSAKEKMIARRVVIAFGQTVCGFDLLRANGKSYVCDVNGFSFVKTSTKYYEDTAKILGNMILRRLATSLSIPWHVPFQADDPPLVSTQSGKIMELRCVLAVIRHGDRTPKQKIKIVVNDARFYTLFKKYEGIKKREIKLKRPAQLMEVLELIRLILNENQALCNEYNEKLSTLDQSDPQYKEVESRFEKINDQVKSFEQLRTILEMYGHFSGINRKVQLKYLKPKDAEQSGDESNPDLLLILKWGGELTTAGVLQAEALGKLFRTLYPGIRRTDGKDCPEDTQGLGFLRLHSTYRHDLKIYASDEGRVQMTAAAFAKGLLALEGELTPILAQMVKSANTDGLLNDDYNARQYQQELKGYLHNILQADRDFSEEDYKNLNPSGLRSINNAMEFIKNPRRMCQEIAGYVQKMCEIIRYHKMNNSRMLLANYVFPMNLHHITDRTLYLNESWDLALRRWEKELREFRKPSKNNDDSNGYDISKIPDIYDNIKYDLEHNPDLSINNEATFERFYLCVKNMADIVVPQEYGISEESKLCVAQRVCTALLKKIRSDLHRCVQNPEDDTESLTRLDPRASENIATPMRHVRTRLYFTSESHIHTLMNLIRFGGLCDPNDKKWNRALSFLSGVTEFNYMTQVVLMVYENSSAEQNSMDRFHIELLFSPGLYPCFLTEKERIYEKRFNSHKNKAAAAPPLNSKKSSSSKGYNSSAGKSSGDPSDKESTDTELTNNNNGGASNANPSTTTTVSGDPPQPASQPVPELEKPTPSATIPPPEQPSLVRNVSNNNLKAEVQPPSTAQEQQQQTINAMAPNEEALVEAGEKDGEQEEDTHESDEDELNDQAINLVVLGEVAGKKFTEMAKSRTNMVEQIGGRKRFLSPDLIKPRIDESAQTSDEMKERCQHLVHHHKNVKELGKCLSTESDARERGDTKKEEPLSLEIGRAKRQQCPHAIVKSMSDIISNRTRQLVADDSAIERIEEDSLLESPDSGLILDASQATVGSGQGGWAKDAKDILSGGSSKSTVEIEPTAAAPRSEPTDASSSAALEQQKPKEATTNYQRPLLATVFAQSSSTETREPNEESVEPAGSISSQNSREDDPAASAQGSSSHTHQRSRSRFPYRFKHHTVNLLTGGNGVENRLISTDVLMGKFTDTTRRKQANNPVVLSTAVIARSSSAPRLQTFKAGDEVQVAEIRRFWPPLRSLETMHDNLSFKQFDQFLDRMLTTSTPLPSPPKTPVHREGENQQNLDRRLKDTIRRLNLMEAKEKKNAEKKAP